MKLNSCDSPFYNFIAWYMISKYSIEYLFYFLYTSHQIQLQQVSLLVMKEIKDNHTKSLCINIGNSEAILSPGPFINSDTNEFTWTILTTHYRACFWSRRTINFFYIIAITFFPKEALTTTVAAIAIFN